MKRIFTFVLCFVLALSLIGCAEVPPMNSGNEAPQVTTVPEAAEAAPEAGEEAPAPAGDEIEVAPDVEFVPVSADAADFEAFQKALADDTVDEILLEKNVTVTEAVTMDKTVIVAEGVTLTLEGGVDFFVDNGLLENNGTLVVTGAADAASRPAALAIVNGGGMLNNGSLILNKGKSSAPAPTPAPVPVPVAPVAPAAPAVTEIPDKQAFIAAVSAAIAEDMGTDVSALRILSVKRL